jgi:ribosome biogenesis GTPase
MTDSSREFRIASVSRRSVTFLDGRGEAVTAQVSGNVYRTCHPVVGDIAEVTSPESDPVVIRILPRSSLLERTSPLGDRKQVIAANIDAVIIIASLDNPPFRRGFVDRAIATSVWRDLEAWVVLNKIDLASCPRDGEMIEGILADYGPEGAGCSVFAVSAETGDGIEPLRNRLSGLTVVMTGQSGTGKTSIARCLNPSLDLATGALNTKTGKGRHTTVKARLLPLGGSTFLIDTPGLRMFSIDHIPPDELCSCFSEFGKLDEACRFGNCLHNSEPDCAVHAAVESGKIGRERYMSYLNLMEEIRKKT